MQSIIVYAPHKSGTMFLHELMLNITMATGIPYYSVNLENFPKDKVLMQDSSAFLGKSGLFGPIRHYVKPPDVNAYKIILHMRDPRDVLTSLFYSHAYSHSLKEGVFNPSQETRQNWIEQGIDSFVMETAGTFNERYTTFCKELLHRNNVNYLKYEEMVTDFPWWLAKFLEPFPIYEKEMLHMGLCQKFQLSFKIEKEDIYKNKRQVTPGDHRRKLKSETIHRLNNQFGEVMGRLGYPI